MSYSVKKGRLEKTPKRARGKLTRSKTRSRVRQSAPRGQVQPAQVHIIHKVLDVADDSLAPPLPTPWAEAVNGHDLLEALEAVIRRHVVVSPEQAIAIALWMMHTWVFEAAETAPRLVVKSVTMRAGKTKLLTVLNYMVPRPLASSNLTPAVVFRVIDQEHPTLLIDESDTFLKSKDLIGILNSGHKPENAYVIRMDGKPRKPTRFSTYTPIVIAGIGNRAATLEDRSVVISLERRRQDEQVIRLDSAAKVELKQLASQLRRWSDDNLEALRNAAAHQVPGIDDRAADNWEPLFAIAALAGANDLERARAAALTLLRASLEGEEDPLPLLLEDIQAAFGAADKIASEELVQKLAALEGRPWAEWKGLQPLSKHQLAILLRPLKIQPMTIRLSQTRTPKGYKVEQFADAFARYVARAPTMGA